MKSLGLISLLLLCLPGVCAHAGPELDGHERTLLALHLGVAHPLSSSLLSRQLSVPSATQEMLQ